MKLIVIAFIQMTAMLSFAANFDQESAEVNNLLLNTNEVRFNYCIDGTMTCRTLVMLADKSTMKPVKMFYNNFFSSERRVAISGYFLKNGNGSYRAYSDATFDGKVNIDAVNDWDKKIRVTFDSNGFPTLHDLYLKNLGTTKYSIAKLVYNQKRSMIMGTTFDTANPDFSEPLQIIYNRVR